MDKITYLAELAEGLARWVPKRERQDILRYYAEYFEEAGPEREAEVIAELGDPWALSCRLAVEGGYVTHEKAVSWPPKKKWPRVLVGTAVGLAVFALVASIGMLGFKITRTVSNVARTLIEDDPMSEWGMVQLEPDGAVTIADSEYFTFIAGEDLTDFYYTDGGNLPVFDSIDADISVGNIEVIAGDDFTLSIGRSSSLTGYEPAWEVQDGVLKLRYDGGNIFGVGQQGVEVIITVPENAALDNINVETGVGDVLLWGVNAGTVTAETGVGKVECYGARSVRKLGLSTGIGDVGLILEEVRPGLDIKLESGTGNVEISLGCSENDCSYGLESGTGAVTINGVSRGHEAKRRDSALCSLYAESGTGDVSVYFTCG